MMTKVGILTKRVQETSNYAVSYFEHKIFLILIGIAIMKHLSILITCLLCTGIGYSQTVQIQAGTTITSLDWKLGSTINLYEEPMIGYAVFAGLQYLDKGISTFPAT